MRRDAALGDGKRGEEVKVSIDMSQRTRTARADVTIDMEPLVVDFDVSPVPVATAMAADVRKRIDAQPGDRWNKTGALRAGIATQKTQDGAEVTVPADRLSQPELRAKFVEEVVNPDPFEDEEVMREADRLLTQMLGGA